MFDTVSYWSGVRAVRSGHPGTTTLGASFYNFTASAFLRRGGRVPFVDFPLGYPIVAGVIALAVGVRAAMSAVIAASAALVGWLFVIGPRDAPDRTSALLRAAVGVGVVGLPITRLLTRAALSELIFAATVLLLVVSTTRSATSTGWRRTNIGAAAAIGLVRFLGAPLALLPAYLDYRRRSEWRRATVIGVACVLPAAANVVWAGVAGGGHVSRLHGLARSDLRAALLSIGGWATARYGDIGRVFYGGSAMPSAWVWVIAGALVALAVWAVVRFQRRPDRAGAGSVALTVALVLALCLSVGMVGFDALVRPDNRVMLPIGVLVIAAGVWSLPVQRAGVFRIGAVAVTAGWLLLATPPWQWTTTAKATEPAYASELQALPDKPAAYVSNDADGVHWLTTTPAVYLPQPMNAITARALDLDAQYRSLPCDLFRHHAIVVFVVGGLFSGDAQPRLDALTAEGRLSVVVGQYLRTYRPTSHSCLASVSN